MAIKKKRIGGRMDGLIDKTDRYMNHAWSLYMYLRFQCIPYLKSKNKLTLNFWRKVLSHCDIFGI